VRVAAGVIRIALALVTCCAVVAQILFSLHERGASLQNLLSFFTIESNLIAAVTLLIAGVVMLVAPGEPESLTMLRGASTVYMITTGIVYTALLSGIEGAIDSTIPWVNMTLHYVMPCAIALDWILFAANIHWPYARVLARWLAFPFFYLIYSLVRGARTGWYPYPFLNPDGGYARVLATAAIITIFVGIISVAVLWYGKRSARYVPDI